MDRLEEAGWEKFRVFLVSASLLPCCDLVAVNLSSQLIS